MQLGKRYDARHYSPRYNPWDQRLCLVPDGDFFRAIRAGKADVVTDGIVRFTPTGLLLQSGQVLDADVIVTATGLKVQLFGGMRVVVDGVEQDPGRTLAYKGMMYSGIPNLASAFGYTNASWTLKSELTARYVCRLLRYMDQRDLQWCAPQPRPGDAPAAPAIDFSSGYVQRAVALLPKQGARQPWKNYQNYFQDLLALKYTSVNDGVMRFGRAGAPSLE
jgi:cation diffusion facilitator CzcD-associated flavoprotein CzcO